MLGLHRASDVSKLAVPRQNLGNCERKAARLLDGGVIENDERVIDASPAPSVIRLHVELRTNKVQARWREWHRPNEK